MFAPFLNGVDCSVSCPALPLMFCFLPWVTPALDRSLQNHQYLLPTLYSLATCLAAHFYPFYVYLFLFRTDSCIYAAWHAPPWPRWTLFLHSGNTVGCLSPAAIYIIYLKSLTRILQIWMYYLLTHAAAARALPVLCAWNISGWLYLLSAKRSSSHGNWWVCVSPPDGGALSSLPYGVSVRLVTCLVCIPISAPLLFFVAWIDTFLFWFASFSCLVYHVLLLRTLSSSIFFFPDCHLYGNHGSMCC